MNGGFIIFERPVGLMQSTRRRYLAIASVGVGSGVAGCLSSGSNISYPEAESDELGGGSDEDAGEDAAEEEEDAEPAVEAINERLADETDEIYDELRWFETAYESTSREYRGRLGEVVDALDTLLSELETTGEVSAESVAEAREIADDEAADVHELFEPQFENHYNFAALNRQRFDTVNRFREREDWDRVERELQSVRSIYRTLSLRREVEERYSPNPIENRLYEWFAGDQEDRLFEVRYISDRLGHNPDTDSREPGYGAYVLEDASREIRFLETPIGQRNREARSVIDDAFEPFAESTDRSFRLYVRIHDTEDSDDIDPEDTDSLAVYGQQYEDMDAADAAFESVMAEKDIEETVEWGDETWNRVLYTREGRRHYAYFMRAGAYLFAVGPSRTPWEERDDDWNALLDNTWMNPEHDE